MYNKTPLETNFTPPHHYMQPPNEGEGGGGTLESQEANLILTAPSLANVALHTVTDMSNVSHRKVIHSTYLQSHL